MSLNFIVIACGLMALWHCFYCFHNVCRRTLVHQFVLHKVHVWGYVTEELMISCTKVIQSRLPFGCTCKTVLWTFAVAGKQPFTLPALGGKIVASSVRRLVAVLRTSSPPVYSDGCCPVYIRGKQNGRTHIRLR